MSRENHFQVPCGLCGHNSFHPLWVIRGLPIVQCQECCGIYTHERVECDYDTPPDQTESKLSEYRRYYWPARKASALKLWERFEEFRQSGLLLDVGCGFGLFLGEAQGHGWRGVGVEINQGQSAWASQRLGISVLSHLESQDLMPGSFDVVTLWDVIEHVAEPRQFLQRCYELLRPGGLLFLKTPNAEGLLLHGPWWLKPYLFLYRHLVYPANPLEHLYHFTPEVLRSILQELNFSILQQTLDQDWTERPLVGRNKFIEAIRYPLMWAAWRLQLPYEMEVWATSGPSTDKN